MREERPELTPFGVLLRRRRIGARLSQEQLAERARISVQAVSALERGARRSPRVDTLELIATALKLKGVELDEFKALARASAANKVRGYAALQAEGAEVVAPGASGVALAGASFIGRGRELDEIASMETCRCLTLWGPGGVGKTRLATEACASLAAAFGDRIAFVALAPLTDPGSVVRAIASAYDLVDTDLATLVPRLTTRFADVPSLLVLDNCEHLIEEVARVAASLLKRIAALKILATSREPLRIDGERVLAVKPLAIADSQALFIDRAVAAGATTTATGEDGERVARICRRLDGLPLAIELAAARTRSMDLEAIERALDERFDLLTRGNRSLDPRHQTLRDTIAWSYDLLEPPCRIVLERVALLGGPFAIEHAIAIAGDDVLDEWMVRDAVADLVDKALIAFAPGTLVDAGPYDLLESTRLYANARRAEARGVESEAAAWSRFGAWLMQRSAESYASFANETSLILDTISIDHLRAYLHWAIDDGGDLASAAIIVGTLVHWWHAQGRRDEGLRWTERALERIVPTTEHQTARAILLFGKTGLLRLGGDRVAAGQAAFDAYEVARELDETTRDRALLRARIVFFAAESAAFAGDRERAQSLISECFARYEALGDEHGRVIALGQAAEIARLGGEIERCRAYWRESVSYYDALGYRRLAAHARANLADSEFALGDVHAAVREARVAADVCLELSSSYYIANTLSNLAAYLPDIDAIDETADVVGRGFDVAREGGFEQLVARLSLSGATVAVRRKRNVREAAVLAAYAMPRCGDASFTEARLGERLRTSLRELLDDDALRSAALEAESITEGEAARLLRIAIAR